MAQLKGSWDEGLASIVTWRSRWRDNAKPITSNPGPMLAEEQGILITKEDMIVYVPSVRVQTHTQNIQRWSDSPVCDSECLGTKKLADVGKFEWRLFPSSLEIWIGFDLLTCQIARSDRIH